MISPPSPFDRRKRYQICRLLLLCVLLAACQAVPPAPASSRPAAGEVPALPDAPVYVVEPSSSRVKVLAYSDGSLSGFGHNHVLIAPVSGKVHAGDTAAESGFLLEIQVEDFVVDPPVARVAEGEDFASELSAQDRRGTRENLLGENLLNARRYPRILIQSMQLTGSRRNPDVVARVTLRGVSRDIEFPATVSERAGALEISADFTIVQSDFGIEPFSVLGGALKVRDALKVNVQLIAEPAGD